MRRAVAALGLIAGLPTPVAAQAILVERIVAVVDSRPVLLSEVRVTEQATGREPAAALEALIDERLMFREAARLPQAVITAEEEDRALDSLRVRASAAAASLPERDLRQLARRQATIVKYVEFRFRPQVRVDEEAVRRAWEAAGGARGDRPDFETAAPELRRQAAEEDLRQRIEAWVKELRAGAEVRYNGGADPAGSS